MTDSPLESLRAELLDAAARRYPPEAVPRRRRHRPRRTLVLAFVLLVLLIVASALAASGVINLGAGHTPDGSTYNVTQRREPPLRPGADGRICQTVTIRDRGAFVAEATGCASADAQPRVALAIGSVVEAPGDSLILTGTVSKSVNRVAVAVASVHGPIELRAIRGSSRRFFTTVVPRGPTLTVSAYDRSNTVVQRTSIPWCRVAAPACPSRTTGPATPSRQPQRPGTELHRPGGR